MTAGTRREAWWRCSKDPTHEWKASVNGRRRGNGCPVCAGYLPHSTTSLESLMPELSKEWHPTKNGDRKPSDVTLGSAKLVWWRCSVDPRHEWNQGPQIAHAVADVQCVPEWFRPKEQIWQRYPSLAAQWDSEKNGTLTPSVSVRLREEGLVAMRKDPTHVWEAQIKNRVNGSGCPACRMGWTVPAIGTFVDGLKHHLQTFTPAELYVLFQQNGLLGGRARLSGVPRCAGDGAVSVWGD